ncbi:hypothetical protein HK102_000113, partial [Quaeritorhiza haematococci]
TAIVIESVTVIGIVPACDGWVMGDFHHQGADHRCHHRLAHIALRLAVHPVDVRLGVHAVVHVDVEEDLGLDLGPALGPAAHLAGEAVIVTVAAVAELEVDAPVRTRPALPTQLPDLAPVLDPLQPPVLDLDLDPGPDLRGVRVHPVAAVAVAGVAAGAEVLVGHGVGRVVGAVA